MTIAVVGIGLDGKAGLAYNVQEIVEQATILAGSKRHLSYFADHPAEKLDLANLNTGIEAISKLESSNNSIVVLTSGDPLFFWFGQTVISKI